MLTRRSVLGGLITAPFFGEGMTATSTVPWLGNGLLVHQGAYDQSVTGMTTAQLINAMVQFDCCVLSHVATFNFSSGAADTMFANIGALVSGIKSLNPSTEVFGYVPSTADAPDGSDAGQNPANPHWAPPDLICHNVIAWVDAWAALPTRPDGIFFDLVHPGYISKLIRNDCISYAKFKNFRVMVNTTVPDSFGIGVQFGAETLQSGDYLMIEGFDVAGGVWNNPNTVGACMALAPYRANGVRLAALATEAAANAHQVVSASSTSNQAAKTVFNYFFQAGDKYQFTTSDLGLSGLDLPPRCI